MALVVVVLGLFFLLLFRGQIGRLLDRTSLSKEGSNTYDAKQTSAKRPDALTQFLEGFQSPVYREMEAFIESDLQERRITDPDDVRTALLKMLARAIIYDRFEETRQTIYGSQVSALNFLNEHPTPIKKATLETRFYNPAITEFPTLHKNSSFEAWLEYLRVRVLVVETKDGMGISPQGREFLKWRVDTGRRVPTFG